ncbi:ataxin-10-like [Lineus longissimus]|uniref:ataxin-10-like n=1 Tax=Lineus longissimus TaxID=88925 RepID=UPI002B4C7221
MAADEKFLQNLQFFRDYSASCDKSNNPLSVLKNVTITLRDEGCRQALPTSFLDDSTNLAKSLINDIRKVHQTDPQLKDKFAEVVEHLEVVAEVYRCLRNCCARCKRNQLYIGSNVAFLKSTKEFLAQLLHFHRTIPALVAFTLPSQNITLKLQCLYSVVQCLGNLVTDCPENHEKVWLMFGTLFAEILKLPDNTLTDFICMVLMNCKSDNERRKQLTSTEGWKILEEVLRTVCHEDIEWGVFYLEDLMKRQELFSVAYKELQDSERMVLLDFIHAEVSSSLDRGDRPVDARDTQSGYQQLPSNDAQAEGHLLPTDEAQLAYHCLPSESLRILAMEFKDNAHLILGTSRRPGEEVSEPKLVLRVLDILCTATAADGDYISIQDDIDLLKCCLHLLHTMFLLGQQDDNNPFSSRKLSDVTTLEPESSHPMYGLKRDLIRLIGNMVHRNKRNQDQVRELGGIPLILDHTNIDGRNPFILQWAIFTIRNLCEDNRDNQAVIANMNLQGVANSAELLRDFGVEAVVENGKIVVKSSKTR